MSKVIFPNSARAIPKTQTERDADQARADQAQSSYAAMPDPPDEPGDEMTYGARVWRTYVRETDQADKELVEGRNNSLDVLLIFAALFSAISTAFIIESVGDLKPDPAESSAQTLLAISRTLAAISNSQPVDSSSLGSVDTPTFSPSRTAVVVNALWFLSLSLSVAVSLIAMLAKEWCYMFLSRRSGLMYEQARRRQERWNGIERWKMKEVVTYLPGLMHLALLLFAIGLSIYLWDVNKAVAIPVVLVTTTAFIIYSWTTVVSFFDKFCPYTTPATSILHIARYELLLGVAFLCSKISYLKWLANVSEEIRGSTQNRQSESSNLYAADIKVPMDEVTGQMLEWLVTNCEDSRSVDIAVQALAGASTGLLYGPFRESELMRSLPERVSQFLDKCHIGTNNAHVLNDQRRLALVMLYSRINNLLLYTVGYPTIIGDFRTDTKHLSGIPALRMLLEHAGTINNPNALALVVATAMPACSQRMLGSFGYEFLITPSPIKELAPKVMASLLEEYRNSEIPSLSPNVLHALVKSSLHYLVGLYPRQSVEERQILVPLSLAQLYLALPSNSADLHTIAVALAATEFSTYSYPEETPWNDLEFITHLYSWAEEPSNNRRISRYSYSMREGSPIHSGVSPFSDPMDHTKSRRRRAFKVIKHYQRYPPNDVRTYSLFRFGFFGLLSELTSDSWTRHANTINDILESPEIQEANLKFGGQPTHIHTLPLGYTSEAGQILAASRCLLSISKFTFTQDAEKAMITSCLQHFLSENDLRGTLSFKLYFAALVALRYAQSIELQRFCLRIISYQPAPLPSEALVQELSENLVLSHLKYISTSNSSHIVLVSIIQTALLVTAILLSTDAPSHARQAALETMIEQESSLDPQPVDIINYYSRLSEAIDQTSGPEALRYIVQCAAEFYHATAAERAEMDAQIVADAGRYDWNEKLQRLKDSYKPEPLRDDSSNESEPDAQDPAGGGTDIGLAQTAVLEIEQETPG